MRLDWSVADETGVQGYNLCRHTATNPRFQLVARRLAAGRRHYRCLDAGTSHLACGGPLACRLATFRSGGGLEAPGAQARS